MWFTTGRVVSHYLSGEQTRRIGPLVDQYPDPLCELHPRFAAFLGVEDGDLVRVTSRRGSIDLPARVTSTIRPDTVFIPYHWGGRQAANQLTNPVLDPESKIPEYKVCAVRVERLGPGPASGTAPPPSRNGRDDHGDGATDDDRDGDDDQEAPAP
jgi:assimilatory nitrate reductase catalytic subunit